MAVFDIERDLEQIATGDYFWCSGHLSAVPIAERSDDTRYCQRCFKSLSDDAALLSHSKRPSWVPRCDKAETSTVKEQACDTAIPVVFQPAQFVTTPTPSTKSDIDAKIAALDAAGLKGRAVAAKLAEEGIFVSYRTVYRRQKGSKPRQPMEY